MPPLLGLNSTPACVYLLETASQATPTDFLFTIDQICKSTPRTAVAAGQVSCWSEQVEPELLKSLAGSAVTAEGWASRRKELESAVITHQFGGMPPQHESVEGNGRGSGIRSWPGISYRTHEVRVKFSAGELSLTLSLWLPNGAGPFPVLLDIDGCWRYLSDDVIRTVVDRGYIAASVDRTEAADDNKDHYRDSGLYRIFPDAKFGVCSAWAWAAHRCVDALTTMLEVQSDGIAVTGHSRGGKTAILAGATDDRIAVTNPNNSGCGGAGLLRLKGSRAEEIDSFWSRDTGEPQNAFWFGKGWHNSREQDDQLPYDSHFLHAMVAPRALLLTEAYEDFGANPASSYLAAQCARQVYSTLGAEDSIGWAFREGGHNHAFEDYGALLDFMDVRIKQEPIVRDFQRQLFPDLADVLKRFDDPGRVPHGAPQ